MKKKTILDAGGEPITPTPNDEPKEAPVALEPRVIDIEDGPLRLRAKVEFTGVVIGGRGRADLISGVDKLLRGVNQFGVRMIELLLMGSMHKQDVLPILADALDSINQARKGVEFFLGRVQEGLPPVPVVETAQAGPQTSAPRLVR